MNPDVPYAPPVSRTESTAFYVFLITLILAPIVFWPSLYITQELTKAIVISLGTLITAILLALTALRERTLNLPPKRIVWTSSLVVISLIISALMSVQATKSFFGQGFEVSTAGFISILFLAGLVAYSLVLRRPERAMLLYVGMTVSFAIVYIFHLLRLIFGPSFAGFSVFNSATSTMLGPWFDLGSFALVVTIVSILALTCLQLSSRIRLVYGILAVLSAIAAILVNNIYSWVAATLVFVGILVHTWYTRSNSQSSRISWRYIAILPLIAGIVSAVFLYKGTTIIAPVLNKLNIARSELILPWQLTLDVAAGAIKDRPLFGVGPNLFNKAYITYKPAVINTSDAWGIEFAYGFGFLPTLVITQGIVGSLFWLFFFIAFGVLGVRVLRRLPNEPSERFILVSSYSAASFLWLVALVSVPQHVLLLYAFVLTGTFFASAVAYGSLKPAMWAPQMGSTQYKMMPALLTLLMVVGAVWALLWIKNAAALSYFGSGVKELTVLRNSTQAAADFRKALSLQRSDVYWQALAETGLSRASDLAQSLNSGTSATSSQAVLKDIVDTVNQSAQDARSAIAFDPSNYYNYVSEARVSEVAVNLRMSDAYEIATKAYMNAIRLNPQNPALYLGLARLQALQEKYDDALRTIGATLQVKNNYLDAIFLLTQVQAAKGNVQEAITAAKVATEINPQSPLLQFQLGLLEYTAKDYTTAVAALTKAVALQDDYANARYFLGLSQARLGKRSEAVAQFEKLVASNPDNQEVALILNNLRSGKDIFADAKPPVTATPEKRSSLPIKEKQR